MADSKRDAGRNAMLQAFEVALKHVMSLDEDAPAALDMDHRVNGYCVKVFVQEEN